MCIRTKKCQFPGIGSNITKTNPSTTLHFGIHDVWHISGTENIVADALSRVDSIVMLTNLGMQEIAEAQASDDELQQLKQSMSMFLKLKKFTLSKTASNIYYDFRRRDQIIPGLLRK